MKYAILHNWNFFRILRVILGIAIMAQAIMAKDPVFGIAGLLFTILAILNTGCCGSGGCYVAKNKETAIKTKEIIYEEVDQ